MTDTHRYPAQVFWSEADQGFIAIATDLPGCSAFGETQQDALEELQDAIHAWTQAARAAGNPIPQPSPPAGDHHHSGKVLVRMPRRLHAELARAAKHEEVSLNHYIVYLLSSVASGRTLEQLVRPSRAALAAAAQSLSPGRSLAKATSSKKRK